MSLRYGCLPMPIRDLGLYTSLTTAFDFLHCHDAMQIVSFDDSVLNLFTRDDFHINSVVDGVLYPLFDAYEAWIPREPARSPYPLVVESRQHLLRRAPATLTTALGRIFKCPGCGRYAFIMRLLLIFGSKLCLAGGALQYMFHRKGANVCCMMSDIDIFLLNFDYRVLEMFIIAFAGIYQEFFGEYTVVRTPFTVTFFRLKKQHRNTVQIILRSYPSTSAVLDSFDLDSSCFALYRNQLVASARGLRCLTTSVNTVDVTKQSTTFERRLVKYFHKYDIGIAVPHFMQSRLIYPRATYGLSLLLEALHRPAGHTKALLGYSAFTTGIVASVSLRTLKRNIAAVVGFSRFATPFLIRVNNPLVFTLLGDEAETVDPALLPRESFEPPSGSFIPLYGPWYAEAYGGELIPEIAAQIAAAVPYRPICRVVPSWRFHVSTTSVLRSEDEVGPVSV
jgi:hypothetical protein